MSRITTLILLAIMATSALGQRRSDRETANLVGKVKSVAESSLRYSGAELEPRDTIFYDVQGNEIEHLMVSDFGETLGKQSKSFDGLGFVQKVKFEDAKGRLVGETRYSYSDGRLVAVFRYDAGGVLREKTATLYDQAGRVTEEIYYDPNTERAKTVFRHDEKGNMVEVAFFLANGSRAVAPVGPCLGAHRLNFRYDEKGRVTAKTVFEPDGSEKKSWTYTYDEKGNQIGSIAKSQYSTIKLTYTYEFDRVGNWTKRTVVMEDDDSFLEQMKKVTGSDGSTPKKKEEALPKPTQVSIRKITYYEQ